MILIKRLKNLWKLSELPIEETVNNPFLQRIIEASRPHKMAQIIKRENAVDKFLKEAKENE